MSALPPVEIKDNTQKIVIKHLNGKWEVTFKGPFISTRDMSRVNRALYTQHRLYLRKRVIESRKGITNG